MRDPPPVARPPIQSENAMNKRINRKTQIHLGVTPAMDIPAPKNVRSVFSTPELRDSDIPQNSARLRRARSRQSESGASHRRSSWFSVTAEIIEGRKTLIRKVFDVFGCTKGDRFDINDFEYVKPRAPIAIQAFRSTERDFSPNPPRRPLSLSWGQTRAAPTNVVTRR